MRRPAGQALQWLLLTLAAYRLWRFVARDDLTVGLRMRVPDRVAEPLVCPWCAGTWIAVGTIAVARQRHDVQMPAVQAAASCAVVGLIGDRLDPVDA